MDEPIRLLGDYPIDALAALIPDTDDPVWDVRADRQRRFEVHTRTRSIVFVLGRPAPGMTTLPVPERLDYAPAALAQSVRACGETMLRHFPGGRIQRLLLAELPPMSGIPPHKDGGMAMSETYRCHAPVLTHPDVAFMIDDRDYYLKAGCIYVIDNMRRHGVENRSSMRRVHLICNIAPALMATSNSSEFEYGAETSASSPQKSTNAG
jgi:hypothetical protein